ncbi:flagellar protein MotY [Halopseudomonas salina]|uniref:Membrane protein n=1 Tax=Halopseudomonas salina TaxID=1323744 RepID=A0ABQ1P6N7_9GAMM|nr:OmpA family protein [Halopseudomonas salina]GGC90400.1 membrane protein [Halopseudomonas salina]
MARACIALLLTVALPAHALTFQTRMEEVEWSVEGDKFECRLTQPVSGYGDAVFVRRAGERPVFELKAWNNLMRPGQAQLYNDAPMWQPQARARLLGYTAVSDEQVAIRVPQQQAGQMLAGLASGLHPTIQRAAWANAVEPVRVVVSSIGYQQAWTDFQKCSAGLLPMNFDQISNSVVSFASGGTHLSASAKQLLDTALEYLQADEEITGIVLEGHSDNVGNRLDNRELARQRALAVRNYLVERGVAEELFSLRFHGDRYPVASNRSAEGRALNRRVNLKLEKS